MQVQLGGEASGPLRGVRGVDASAAVSGPLCGQILGDLSINGFGSQGPYRDPPAYGSVTQGLTGFFPTQGSADARAREWHHPPKHSEFRQP
jgi:crotonobetainyl-CoA:carnitine CoA-transferase CaiB-like acyl-CoA transferase